MDANEGKYLTFSIGKEELGIPIHEVKEIIGIMDITSIPRTPDYIKGVINLRGKIIPIMDLRLKFGMEGKEYDQRTCIIVVEIDIGDKKKQMGIVVDTVSEVLNIGQENIDPPPNYGMQSDSDYLTGMGKINDKVILLFNIEKVLSSEELVLLERNNMEEKDA